MSPLDRFLALTLCIEQAVGEGRLQELPSLIESRGEIIRQLADAGHPLPTERLASIREAEQRLMTKLQSRRNATLERMAKLRTAKSARTAYSRLGALGAARTP